MKVVIYKWRFNFWNIVQLACSSKAYDTITGEVRMLLTWKVISATSNCGISEKLYFLAVCSALKEYMGPSFLKLHFNFWKFGKYATKIPFFSLKSLTLLTSIISKEFVVHIRRILILCKEDLHINVFFCWNTIVWCVYTKDRNVPRNEIYGQCVKFRRLLSIIAAHEGRYIFYYKFMWIKQIFAKLI